MTAIAFRRPVFLLAALAAFGAAGCSSSPEPVAASPVAEPALSGDYTRLLKRSADDFSFELAIRTFRPASGDGPVVTLVPAIHIGTKKYYREIQYVLDRRERVLFEGVSEDPDAFKKPVPREKAEGHLYAKIAKALGLVPQLGSIDYDRKSFVNADLPMSAIRAKLELEAKQPGETGEAARGALTNLAMLDRLLSGQGLMGPLVEGMLGFVAGNPALKAQVMLMLADAEKKTQGKQAGGMGRLMAMIVDDRNAEAMRRLDATLKEPHPPATVAVFYGAAHLRGMEKILVRDMGYRLESTEWIAAYEVRPVAAGLPASSAAKATERAVSR